MVTSALVITACGGNVVDEPGVGGGQGTTTTASSTVTFTCGSEACSASTEYCRDRLPLQPPPQGDGVEVVECLPLPAACGGVASCPCVPQLDCDVIDCAVDADGALRLLCKESI